MKFGKYFKYNGRNSEDFGVIITSFEKDDDLSTGLERTMILGESTKYRFRPNHYGMKYEENLTFRITFIKDVCSDTSNYFTRKEVREINRWLTSTSYPTIFHMYDEDYDKSDESVDYNGVFNNVEYEVLGNSDVIGIIATFTNDSPFAYTPIISKTLKSTLDQPYELTINNDSDELENPLYPLLLFYPNSTTDVTISNMTENKSMTFKNIVPEKPFYIDCDKMTVQYIGTNELIELHTLGIEDIGDIYWFRLQSGRNKVKITGDVEVKVKYRELRKVGAY